MTTLYTKEYLHEFSKGIDSIIILGAYLYMNIQPKFALYSNLHNLLSGTQCRMLFENTCNSYKANKLIPAYELLQADIFKLKNKLLYNYTIKYSTIVMNVPKVYNITQKAIKRNG